MFSAINNVHNERAAFLETLDGLFVGFLRGGYSRGGGNWETLKIPREDWGTLGKIRGIPTPLKNPISYIQKPYDQLKGAPKAIRVAT